MPSTIAALAALLLNHPTCIDCLAERTQAASGLVRERLVKIGKTFALRRADRGPCSLCGRRDRTVFFLRRFPERR